MDALVLKQRRQQVLYDEKWKKFLKKTWLFRLLPFVEFVLTAGSLATGAVNTESDCDVIISVKYGRIFTARFFAVIAFGLFGWRRKKWHGPLQFTSYGLRPTATPRSRSGLQFASLNSSTHQLINSLTADKVCLNHFVTKKSFRLKPPHQDYWRKLYLNLVPVFGKREALLSFWQANADWLGMMPDYHDDLRHKHQNSSWFKKLLEWKLNGRIGDAMEQFLKNIQVKKIERSLKSDPPGWKPRIRYGDDELEFHPDTRRIEDLQK